MSVMSGTRVQAEYPSERQTNGNAKGPARSEDTNLQLRHIQPSVLSPLTATANPEDGTSENPEEPPAPLYETYVLSCLAEYVGMTLFIVIISLVTGHFSAAGPNWLIGVALTNGFAIVSLVVAIGPVSGAHLNPAVTMVITLSGGFQPILVIPYVMAQLTGSITGAYFTKAILPNTTYALCHGGANSVGPGMTAGGAILCEVLITAFLVLIILMSGVDSEYKNQPLPPLAIGMAVVVGIMCGGPFSGGSMNPARAFGPAVASGVWDHHYVWWVGPLLGGLVSAGIYRTLMASQDRRLLSKMLARSRRAGNRGAAAA
ncbi:AQP8 [Branchiostoma lanceolatum]|uniref:AQP8 protein n=1 Tax=Branchiostoma lanceolatum TaxID=7740 RepID=A0A8K0EYL9_BRALA|nr:AQP8 [Branchiostoma lanceolatum]